MRQRLARVLWLLALTLIEWLAWSAPSGAARRAICVGAAAMLSSTAGLAPEGDSPIDGEESEVLKAYMRRYHHQTPISPHEHTHIPTGWPWPRSHSVLDEPRCCFRVRMHDMCPADACGGHARRHHSCMMCRQAHTTA